MPEEIQAVERAGATGSGPRRPPGVPWQVWFVLLASIWGLSFLFIKEADQALSAVQVTFARLAIGTGTLLVILALQRGSLPRGRTVWFHLAVAGLLLNVTPFSLYAFSENYISSGLAGIWNATTPLFTMLAAMLVLSDEPPTRSRLAGLMLGFAGVLVVLNPLRFTGAGGTGLLVGSLAALTAAACYGIGFPYTRRFLAGRPDSAVALSAGQQLCATIEAGLLMAASPHSPGLITPQVVGSILALGVLGTGLAYIVNYAVVRASGATIASTVTYLIPVFAVIAGIVVLGEHLSWNEPAGGAVVLLGVALAQGRLNSSTALRWRLVARVRPSRG